MTDLHPRTYWTADRSALVEEGDERAAFLAYPSSDPIPPEHLALLASAPVEVPTAPTAKVAKPRVRAANRPAPAKRK